MNEYKYCLRTQTEIDKLIASKYSEDLFKPSSQEMITVFETRFELQIPDDFRFFLNTYGTLGGILGIDKKKENIIKVLLLVRVMHQKFPDHFIPVEVISKSEIVCLDCNRQSEDFGKVFSVNGADLDQKKIIAACFRDYFYEKITKNEPNINLDKSFDRAWKRFEYHVLEYQKKYSYDHDKGGKLPRNHEWRPYRYCIQDVVFGVVVVKHSREHNNLSVDVFLTADVPEYGPLAGARALAVFLLSEAYKCGGTMEIYFTNEVEGGCIPDALRKLGQYYGIDFQKKNIISPEESKALYAAITEFSPSLQQKINTMENQGRIKMAQACYVVNHGVWTREQVEMIILGSELPESVLTGGATPEQRHLYSHNLLHARSALLGGMLDRVLSQRFRAHGEIEYDMENDTLPLEISFNPDTYAKEYQCSEPVRIPWLYPNYPNREATAGIPFNVLVRARDAADLLMHFREDLNMAAILRDQLETTTLLLFPHDYYDLPEETRSEFHNLALNKHIGLMVCPEYTLVFDKEAAQKLAGSRILRQ